IPPEVKHCAINLYDRGVLDLSEILDCVGFGECTFYRVLACWRETGDVIPHKYGLTTGCPRAMLYDNIDYLLCLVRHKPNYFLLEENRFMSLHYSTIMQELSRCNISLKKLRRIAKVYCPFKHAAYVAAIGQYIPDQLGFIDETSKDDRTPGQKQGQAKKG
ncbi:hypothetical protein F5876DRAFT_52363, partial [Lentinula aff. lateritia]